MNLLSLFSGCGGMDLGFEGGFTCFAQSITNQNWIESEEDGHVHLVKTQFNTIFANDIRSDAQRAWINYFKDKIADAEEIYSLNSIVDLVEQANNGEFSFPDPVDIVTGGFPCQDFSIAGKRNGFESNKSHHGGAAQEDEPTIYNRGHLYIWMREVVTLTEPKIFVAENVKGLTNLNDVKEVIERYFAKAGGGYVVVPARVLYAPDYGVPQSRERVIFYGFKKSALKPEALKALTQPVIESKYDPYPVPTHKDNPVSCGEVLLGLEEPEFSNDLSQQKYSKAKYMGKHCQGQTEINLDSVGPTIRSEHHGNIEYRRLSAEHGGKHLDELQKNLPERRLTVRECARIQTFPDDYEFVISGRNGVSASNAYKIIGNAVPPVLGFHIAMTLQEKWNNWFKEDGHEGGKGD